MTQIKTNANIFEKVTGYSPKRSLQTMLIGRPLSNEDAPHQTIGKLIGLAVFSSDALSSVAYGPQELMVVLVGAGMLGLRLAFPIAIAIVTLLLILTISYEQTIHAYPDGGGAYIVSRDNLGELPAQIAGAALLTDYILTVAVSISSGVAQLGSAFAALNDYRVEIAVVMILLMTVVNLRGVRESGIAFAIPAYIFLFLMFTMVITGFVRLIGGSLGAVVDPPHLESDIIQPLTLFLILRAFANGTTSLTGVEAISNGITAFSEPRAKNAGTTLMWMAGILGTLLLGITYLSVHIGAVPVEAETVISQLARTVFSGRGAVYLFTISFTTVILVMAANTAFAGFPRLAALQAGDGFLPRQLTFRGSRLVFTNGIIVLGVMSALLVVLFNANVTSLIPLYAIGVFMSFTLSQTGMAHRWWKSGRLKPGEQIVEAGSTVVHDKTWKIKMAVNTIGAICTFIVMIVFAVTKFREGAWVVILLIPLLVLLFFTISHHYRTLAKQLSLEDFDSSGLIQRNRVIMPISGVHKGTLDALRYARTISDDVTAVHISVDSKELPKFKEKWLKFGEGYRLVVLHSPYRIFLDPLLQYIDELVEHTNPADVITIVVPQFVPEHWWSNFLHMRTAEKLRKALLNRTNVVITEVPYQVK